ncbi:hypothetical protein BUALT_Bualt16G0074800 [Buddleja alternifolia]|uniref:SWIM-type domain-containing protein n=1 Tax=Buddleja alternifolia TaxID=168488 RepID=A0AAV6WBM5_9LAMI|nr:hypothetical protein BUALT_Bualt16G0074800 [Buddleja alternifolia]
MLAAVGRDGNDNLYPIAYAFVKVEKFDTWDWFLNLLLRDIGSHAEKGWAFLSDTQKGLIEAVHKHAPTAEHRYCLRHMYNNFKGKFKGEELKRLFWKAASTYNVKQHFRVMKKIERICPKRGPAQTPFEWLSVVPSAHWARCFFPIRTKWDVIVNNISESFNSYILEARGLPIIQMFEWLRMRLMARIQIKREGMERYTRVVCPNILKKIEKQRELSRNCFATWAGGDKFEVKHFLEKHVVHLDEQYCSCRMFQLAGYPCCHAMGALGFFRREAEDYVDPSMMKDVYLRVYNHGINPVSGMHDFDESSLGNVDPPHVKPRVGRPTKKRRRDGNDNGASVGTRKGLTHTCSICHEQGHNKAGHHTHTRQNEMPATASAPSPSQTEVPPQSSQAPSRRRRSAPSPSQPSATASQSHNFSQSFVSPDFTSFEMPDSLQGALDSNQSTQSTLPELVVPPMSAPIPSAGSQPPQVTEVPPQVPRQSPKSRKQQNPISLSSKKLQNIRKVLNPTPNPTFKRPCCAENRSTSTSTSLKSVAASYKPKSTAPSSMSRTFGPSSMPKPRTTVASSMPKPASTLKATPSASTLPASSKDKSAKETF